MSDPIQRAALVKAATAALMQSTLDDDVETEARMVVDAIEPLIREQIAQEIESAAERTCDCDGCVGWNEAMRDAAAIARGATP